MGDVYSWFIAWFSKRQTDVGRINEQKLSLALFGLLCLVSKVEVLDFCKLSEGFDFNEMLSHTSQSVYYIHGRYGWKN